MLFLKGDQYQIAEQVKFLKGVGIGVTCASGCYVLAREKEARRALSLIWEMEIPGFWHYREELLQLRICREEEFQAAVDSLSVFYLEKAVEAK